MDHSDHSTAVPEQTDDSPLDAVLLQVWHIVSERTAGSVVRLRCGSRFDPERAIYPQELGDVRASCVDLCRRCDSLSGGALTALTKPPQHPMTVIAAGLAAHARGEEVDEDAMEEACTLAAAAELVRAGLDIDTVQRMFENRDHTFKVAYDRDTDELTVDVVWTDGEGSSRAE